MSTTKFFNSKQNLLVDPLEAKWEFSFLECARQILTSAIYISIHIQFCNLYLFWFFFLSFWGGFLVHFCIKCIALYKLILEAAKYHSLQGKPGLDLPPTLDLIFYLYFSFGLFASVCVCGFVGRCIYLFICF